MAFSLNLPSALSSVLLSVFTFFLTHLLSEVGPKARGQREGGREGAVIRCDSARRGLRARARGEVKRGRHSRSNTCWLTREMCHLANRICDRLPTFVHEVINTTTERASLKTR